MATKKQEKQETQVAILTPQPVNGWGNFICEIIFL